MYARQLQLPRLPIPKLEATVAKYLETLKPLCSAAELAAAHKRGQEFLTNPSAGPALQQLLHQWAKDKPNYLEPLWDTGYLEARIANPVHTNYFLHHGQPPAEHWAARPGREPQLQHAAVLAHSAAEFFTLIRNEELPAEDDGRGGAVCMSQYPRVFGHARIAARDCDKLQNANCQPSGLPSKHFATTWMCEDPTHIVVLLDSHIARVDILGADRRPLPPGAILAQLHAIVAQADSAPCFEVPLGALTYLDRDAAGAARDAIACSGQEAAGTLRMVDSALFVMCLDDVRCSAQEKPGDSAILKRVMHGRPKDGNRWFDKHNLVVMPHGVAAWNLEHAQGDATPILKLLDAQVAHRDAACAPIPSSGAASLASLLSATLSPQARTLLQQGKQQWEEMDKTVQVNALEVPIGSSQIKAAKCPPDAFVQQVFQVACMEHHGKPAAAYESVATRGFLHGRTEVGRSTTSASVALARHMVATGGAPSGEGKELLQAAIAAQNTYLKEAKAGQGVDRHMFALKCMAQHNDLPVPELLLDELAVRSSTWRLSTSNAGTASTDRFGYGPVTTGGYGLGYLIHSDAFKVSVATFEGEGMEDAEWPVSADGFASALERSAHQLLALAKTQ